MDSITVKKRWRMSIIASKTWPNAIYGIDSIWSWTSHVWIGSEAKKKKKANPFSQYDLEAPFARNCFEVLNFIEELWNELKRVIKDGYEKRLSKIKKEKKVNWMSEQTKKRRESKPKKSKISERNSTKEFQRAVKRDKTAYYNTCKDTKDGNRHLKTSKVFEKNLWTQKVVPISNWYTKESQWTLKGN